MKKLFAVLLSVCLLGTLLFSTTVFADEGGGTNPPLSLDGGNDEDNVTPVDSKLYVVSYEKNVVKAGDIATFPMYVNSRTNEYAEDIRISISGTGDYEDKFSLQEKTGWFELSTLNQQTKIQPTLRVATDVPDGRYKLNVTFQYSDIHGNSYSSTDTIMVTVYGRSTDTPYIRNATFGSAEIDKDNKGILNVNIFNPMSASIWDVNVSFNAGKSQNFSLYENFRPVIINNIGAGKTGTAAFSLYVGSGVASGNYPVTFDISYKDAGNNVLTFTETVYVQVNRAAGAGTDNASRPRIIISSYKTDVEIIEAGKEFVLEFSLQNTSSTESVSNIKVVLGSVAASSGSQTGGSSDVFFPAAGSNSFFIEKIGPKQSITNTIKLMTSQSVEPGVYPVKLDISYDSESSTNLTSDEQISFPITQQQRLEIQNFSAGTDSMAGNPVSISGQYINMGKSTIYNFSIGIEGDFTLMEGYGGYVGNLSAGYNDMLDLMVIPTGEGECKGAIVFNYEDSQGNPKADKQEFTVNVSPMDMSGMFGGDEMGGMDVMPSISDGMDEPQQGLNTITIVLICVGGAVVVAAVIVAIILTRKKRKAKKELVEDEED